MKKQSDLHSPNRVRESETVARNFPAPAYTESKPRGVLDRDHPGHITRGAAESHANPVEEKPSGSQTGSRKHR